MPFKHGVYVSEEATSLSVPIVAETGVPYFFGGSPITAAEHPAAVGVPALCTSWDEFRDKFGYSDEWDKYNLCEAAYSHFRLYGCQPAIFCNVFDPETEVEPTSAEKALAFAGHKAAMPSDMNPGTLVIKTTADAASWVLGTDYTVTFDEGQSKFIVEQLAGSSHYSDTSAVAAFTKMGTTPSNADLIAGLEAIEHCIGLGVIPDLIASPGYSGKTEVAAAMATKARAISGIFRAKAVIDLPMDSETGAVSYDEAAEVKTTAALTDENEIVCWGMLGLGERVFHLSTQFCGLAATVDARNGAPNESPSNKNFKMDRLVGEDGEVIRLTKAQADYLNSQGIVTALNFLSRGWVCWGNWTACYPGNADVKDIFIPVSRMFDWIANTCVKTFWAQIDKPMTRRFVDSIVDSCNIWLNGLVGSGKLLGARVEFRQEENPQTDLMAGVIRLHVYITPPSPAVEIDFVIEYDPEYLNNLFAEG